MCKKLHEPHMLKREYILPVASTSAMFLITNSHVEVWITKNNASANVFQNVVLTLACKGEFAVTKVQIILKIQLFFD